MTGTAPRRNSERGLLWVNHEYVNPTIMFPDSDEAAPPRTTSTSS